MGTTEEILKLKVDNQTAAGLASAKKNVKELKQGVTRMGDSFKRNASTILAATATITGGVLAVKKAFDFADEFARFQSNQVAFNSQVTALGLNATTVFAQIKASSGGLIDDNALLQSANLAISLGLEVSNLGDMLEVSRAKARDMGITTQEAFEKLTIALARGSKLRLDDLGIIVDTTTANENYAESIGKTTNELTANDKALAFQTEALNLGREAIDRYDLSQNTLTENMQEFKATMANARIQAGGFFLRIGTFGVSMIQDGMEVMLRFAGTILKVGLRMAELTDRFGITENAALSWQIQIDASFAAADEAAQKSLNNTKLAFSSTKDLLDAQQAALKRPTPTLDTAVEAGSADAVRKEEQINKALEQLRLDNETAQRMGFERELFLMDVKHQQTMEKLIEQGATEAEIRDAQRLQEEQKALAFQANTVKLAEDAAKGEAKAVDDRNKKIKEFEESRVATAAGIATALFNISGKSSKALFGASKVLASAQAAVDTSRAVTAALANPPGPPFTFGIAALTALRGAEQIRSINSTSMGGGSVSPPSGGGGGGGGAVAPPAPVAAAPVTESIVTIRVLSEGPTEQDFINKVTVGLTEDIEDGRVQVQTVKA